jgi:TIR domain-containing protein
VTFTDDIFISYGHLDDEDPAGDLNGWVDLLVERLPILVNNYLGYKPRIWRDEQSLRRHDPLTAAISAGVTQSLLLVPIVSPRYVQSDWCCRELDAFRATAPHPGTHGSRIFKVIKTPLLLNLADREPEPLRELLGYPFFEMDGDMPVEFSPDVGPSKDQRYWTALRRLAWDISNVLTAVKDQPEVLPAEVARVVMTGAAHADGQTPGAHGGVNPVKSPTRSDATTKFVYLAETTSDLAKEREIVRDELQ